MHDPQAELLEIECEKDLDELQSDEDEPMDSSFHIGDRLNPPEACLYSTEQLHTLIHEGLIDLNPIYQREVVWAETKQVKLIDSIYRNFYVPPVVFAVYKDEDGEEVKKCVDGKQRLTSIQKFFDGQIPYRDPRTKKNYWYTRSDSQKSTRLEVPSYWKRDFASKQITCVEYRDLSPSFERDIFQRVQLGMPLTAAEKLQAISSPWAIWISDLEARYISSDGGIADKIDVDMKRGRDFQSLAQTVYCCDGFPEHRVPTAQKMEQWVSQSEGPTPVFKEAMNDVLAEFWHIANSEGLNAPFRKIKKRVAPIEFVFIGVLLYVMRNNSNSDERAEEIADMRSYIRDKFPDVRARGDVVKTLWDFIDKIAEREEDGPHRSSNGTKRTRKRKIGDDDEDDNDDNHYKPTRGRPRSKRTTR